jgi:hypothetical protein
MTKGGDSRKWTSSSRSKDSLEACVLRFNVAWLSKDACLSILTLGMTVGGVAGEAIEGNVPTSVLLRDSLAVCKICAPSVKNLRHIGCEILGACLWDRDRESKPDPDGFVPLLVAITNSPFAFGARLLPPCGMCNRALSKNYWHGTGACAWPGCSTHDVSWKATGHGVKRGPHPSIHGILFPRSGYTPRVLHVDILLRFLEEA